MINRGAKILSIVVVLVAGISCRTTLVDVHTTPDLVVKQLLMESKYSVAQAAYYEAKGKNLLDSVFVSRYDQFFKVIALYDYTYDRKPKAPYRYASCASANSQSTSITEWISIAAPENPFHLSGDKIQMAQRELTSLGLWDGPIDGKATPEFQKAIVFYRFLYGMNVECVLYPYDLMLQSTFCSLFPKDLRCQTGYEF